MLYRAHLLFLLSVLFLTSACKPRGYSLPNFNTLAADPTEELNGNRPPVDKRSAFDLLIYGPDNASKKVPYPLKSLADLIQRSQGSVPVDEQQFAPIVPVMIPIGRSLQRYAADPEFFQHPRVLLTSHQVQKEIGTLELRGNLFIGYSEPANQIEIISYNSELGRYEFQVVEDYGEGLEPKIKYAKRDVCLGCHRIGGPIFPDFAWEETNSNLAVTMKLLAAHPGQSEYEGFPLRQKGAGSISGNDGRDQPTESQIFEDMTSLASGRSRWQGFWRGLGDGADAHKFRGKLIYLILASLHTRIDSGPAPEVAAVFRDAVAEFVPLYNERIAQVPRVDGHLFSRQNPLALMLSQLPTAQSQTWHRRLENPDFSDKKFNQDFSQLVRDYMKTVRQVGAEFREILPRKLRADSQFPQEILTNTVNNAVTNLFTPFEREALINLFGGKDSNAQVFAGRVQAAVTNLENMVARGASDALGARSFRKSTFLRDLFAGSGAELPKRCCDYISAYPVDPEISSSSMSRNEVLDPELRLAFIYCDGCHASGNREIPQFLNGKTEEEVLRNLAPYKSLILGRFEPSGDNPMPLIGSRQGRLLKANPNDYSRLKAFFEKLPE